MKRVSIILVHFNNFQLTFDCVESILKTEGFQLDIVVVDNSQPNDHQLDQLGEMNGVHILFNRQNVGFGAANNRGIRYASEHLDPDYLFLLNNDTVITHNTISELIRVFETKENIGISSCTIRYYDDKEQIWYGGGMINYTKGNAVMTDMGTTGTSEGSGTSKAVSFISGCAMMFSKRSIAEIGVFDEDFFMYYEDLELCIRASKNGFNLWYTSDTVIYHRVQGSSSQASKYISFHPKNPNIGFQLYHRKRGQWIAFRKHLEGQNLRVFKRHFYIHFILKTLQLIILSPYRKDIWKSFVRVWKEIRKYE